MGDLVKRLRYKPCDIALSIEERMVMRLLNGLMDEAADRIEQLEAELAAERAKGEEMKEVLSRIAFPIWWGQEDAKRKGYKVNGPALIALSQDVCHAQRLAQSIVPIPPQTDEGE